MASEPAEPTTRQATNPRVGMFARVDAAIDAFVAEHGKDGLKLGPRTAARIAITTLDEAGLLADPAQTTELEDRAELADQLASANEHIEEQDARISQLEAEVVKQRIIAKNATDHWRQSSILASLRAANAQRGLELRKLNLAMARKNRVIAKRESERDLALWLHAEAAWRVAGFDVLTVALARRNHQLTAERDERQARIDAATAELKKWDALATREGEWMPCRAALAALVGDQGKHLAENQAELGGPKALTSGNSWANRDLDLSGAALRAVEEADDAAGDLP